jgi:hypothetical protein
LISSQESANNSTPLTATEIQQFNRLFGKPNTSKRAPKKKKAETVQRPMMQKATMETNSSGKMVPVMTSGAAVTDVNSLFNRSKQGRSNLFRGMKMPKMSEAGMTFLKACFAAPDFAGQGSFLGIPDERTYPIVPYRHLATGDLFTFVQEAYASVGLPVPSLGPTSRLIIIQPPVPGIAFYLTLQTAPSNVSFNTIFVPVPYDDFIQVFGAINANQTSQSLNDQVNQFRLAANSIELICTSNANTWTGSIRAFKFKLTMSDSQTYTSGTGTSLVTHSTSVTGLESVNATSASSYVSPANLGVFMTALDTEVTFLPGSVPDKLWSMNGGSSDSFGIFDGSWTGLGNLDTNCIVLEGFNSAGQITQFQVRAWSSVEYLPTQGTMLAKMQIQSPTYDPSALIIYRAVVRDLPVAVSYFENDSFWKKLLNTISQIGSAVATIPGPLSWLGTGVGLLAGGVSSLID